MSDNEGATPEPGGRPNWKSGEIVPAEAIEDMAPRRCPVVKPNGQPCRSWAVRGLDACRQHAGPEHRDATGRLPTVPRPMCSCPNVTGGNKHALGRKCVEGFRFAQRQAEIVPDKAKPVPWNEAHGGILELIAVGVRPYAAAKACGVSRDRMQARLRNDLGFADKVADAQGAANEIVEAGLWRLATGEATGVPSLDAIKFYLLNRASDDWKDPRAQRTVTGTVQHVHNAGELISSITSLQEKLQARLAASEQRQLEPPILDAEVVADDAVER